MLFVFLAVVHISLLLYGIQTATAWFRFRSWASLGDPGPEDLPPITILKPLKGLDDDLEVNLQSFCDQDYPVYEIIFCVQDRKDPALEAVYRVMSRNPHRSLSLVVHNVRFGLNPKVNNLAGGYDRARHDLVLISDSNVRVGPGYLRHMASCLDDDSVGLVSSFILGTGARSLGASLENLHLNSFVLSSISFLDRFRNHQIVVGKSMLFSRRILQGMGGLEVLKDVLAEDYVMGRMIRNTGRSVHLSQYMIHNVNVNWSLTRFWKRHTRWGQLRLSLGGPAYVWEMILNPVFLALVPLFCGQTSLTIIGTAFTSSAVKGMGDYLLGRRLGADLKAPSYLLVPLKDLLVGLMWFYPLLIKTVTWREHTYRISRGSRLEEICIPDDLNWPRRLLFKLRARMA